MRYQEDNELHRDFHGSTNMTIDYVARKYGLESIKAILRKTGREVYRSIHRKLSRGDASELLEHLTWFMYREGAVFSLTVGKEDIRLEVFECPAVKHLRKLGIRPSAHFCLQTSEVNAGMCEGTPWSTSTEVIAEGHCIQTFRKKNDTQ